MPTAHANGVTIHYQRAGRGPDVVLIHGLASNLAFWYLAILPALSRDFRVTAYDLRGHGRSEMPSSGYTSTHMANDLDGLLAHLEVERAHLVAHSFGAAVALQEAVLRPERVASLTLADPTIPALRPAPAGAAWRYRRTWSQELERLGVSLPHDPIEGGLELFEELARLPAAAGKGVGTARSFVPLRPGSGGGETAASWRRLLDTTTARAELHDRAGLGIEAIRRVRQPTLALLGGRSRWLATRELLEETIAGCRVAVVPGAGHFHPLVRPGVFVRMVREFLMDVA